MMPPASNPIPKPSVGVAGILSGADGKVLLGRRNHAPGAGLWAFPGGRVHWGEALTDAVVREFFEETGMTVRCGDVLYVGELIIPDAHFVLVDFSVQWVSGEPQPGSDLDAVQWVGMGDLARFSLAAGMARCLSDPRVRERLGWST